MIVYASKMNTAQACELYVCCACADCWLGGDELERAFKLGDKSIRGFWTIRCHHSAASAIARAALLTMRTGNEALIPESAEEVERR